MSKSIFEREHYIDPKYQFLEKYVRLAYKGFWSPAKYEKLIKEVDAPHFFNNMSPIDQEAIRRCILAVSIVEDKVKNFWNSLFMDLPQTVISDVGALFAMMEVSHRISYHALAENLKVDTSQIENHEVLRDRVKYLNKHLENDPKIIGKKKILKKLVLFTSLVERGSLFTSFYILMSYEKASKGLKTISSLQTSTSSEETLHFNFGIDVINIIKEEHPNLWDDYLIDLVSKNIQMAYDTELRLIDWFFANGVPDHLTREEVVNFLNYNFHTIVTALGLDVKFDYSKDLFTRKNEWFNIKLKSTEPDFFDNPVGGYALEKTEININDFQF